MVLELFLLRPDVVLSKIVGRLKDRARFLIAARLQHQSRWAIEQERLLPRQTVKYQPIPNSRAALPEFAAVGHCPVVFKPEHSYLVGQFFDAAIETSWRQQSSIFNTLQASCEFVTKLIGDLRNDKSYAASYLHAAALCVCAMLIAKLEVIAEVNDEPNPGLAVALDVGLTHPGAHGHQRLVRIAADAVVSRNWVEGVAEMAGMFRMLTLEKAAVLLRTFDLLVKCVAHCAKSPQTQELVVVNICAGVVSVHFRGEPERAFAVDLCQYSCW
jgi:hypothetical protein